MVYFYLKYRVYIGKLFLKITSHLKRVKNYSYASGKYLFVDESSLLKGVSLHQRTIFIALIESRFIFKLFKIKLLSSDQLRQVRI